MFPVDYILNLAESDEDERYQMLIHVRIVEMNLYVVEDDVFAVLNNSSANQK